MLSISVNPVELSHQDISADLDAVLQPEESPYRLISWWDMQKFTADKYMRLAKYLEHVARNLQFLAKTQETISGWKASSSGENTIRGVKILCDEIGLRVSSKCAASLLEAGRGESVKISSVLALLSTLEQNIMWEMEDKLFMFISPDRADYYDKPELFGTGVVTRFPDIQFDITEAGNCYSSGRSTAVVFHLMRVLESCVQEFATAIGGITIPKDKDWHNLLDEINREIKKLPGKDARTIGLAASAANLYNVKVAWRNPTMHPKQTYTMEEAEDVMRAVKTFVKELAKII